MFKKISYILTLSTIALIIFPQSALSKMQSANYQIDFDSINSGGQDSSSANYQLSDTAGEVATGNSSSANYQMRAGYQQMNTPYISITNATDVVLPNISGITGGTTSSTTSVTVTTDSYAGYQLSVNSSTAPALRSGAYSFQDYAPAGANPDYVFIINTNGSNFGFSASGNDVVSDFLNNGAVCNLGSSSTTGRCWRGFETTPIAVSQKNSSNHPSGTPTQIHYQASIGTNHIQEAATYQADITLTAVAL